MDFPPNSYVSKASKPAEESATSEEKETKKVVSGKVTRRKKPLGERLKDMFISDGGSFVESLIETVIVPTLKELVITMITQSADGFRQGVEQKLFGEARSRPARPGYNPGGHVSYNRYSSSSTVINPNRRDAPGYERRPRHSNRIEDFTFESRGDAEEVLYQLESMIEKYGHCTVGDYYDLVGETPRSTDESWGWYELNRCVVNVSRDGFVLRLPRPQELERDR